MAPFQRLFGLWLALSEHLQWRFALASPLVMRNKMSLWQAPEVPKYPVFQYYLHVLLSALQ